PLAVRWHTRICSIVAVVRVPDFIPSVAPHHFSLIGELVCRQTHRLLSWWWWPPASLRYDTNRQQSCPQSGRKSTVLIIDTSLSLSLSLSLSPRSASF